MPKGLGTVFGTHLNSKDNNAVRFVIRLRRKAVRNIRHCT